MAKIVDISKYQSSSKIDWKKLAKDVDGVIIRVQYGSNYVDPEYKKHVKNAKKYKVPFGLYAFGCFVSKKDAIKEAKDFMKRADKNAKFLALDVEKETLQSNGAATLAENSQAFIDTLRAKNWKTGFYFSHNYIGLYGLEHCKADFFWIPRYSGTTAKGKKPIIACDLWQYTSVGSVAGYGGNIDISDLNGKRNTNYFFGGSSKPDNAKPAADRDKKLGKFKYGDKAVISKTAKTFATGENLAAFVKGMEVSVIDAKAYKHGKSSYQYLVSPIMSWVKGEDIKSATGGKAVYYNVKAGDTLSAIAVKHNTTTAKIAHLSNLKNPNLIKVGQKLRVK